MNIIIVSTNSVEQENYWQERLKQSLHSLLHSANLVIAVHEDWPGGAGNGLGSLYAFMRAREKGVILYGIDIVDLLNQDASISIYHTAGKGKRLAPLVSSEHNNKAAVKLSGLVEDQYPISILEAVIKQTSLYAPSRKGRLSVFWGDQVFIPSISPHYTPQHHIDILCAFHPFPTQEAWNEKRMSDYGLIAHDPHGNALHIDKVDYKYLLSQVEKGIVSKEKELGTSLGSFSLSKEMLIALLDEFQFELHSQRECYDSDPHFWMPLTQSEEMYLDLMKRKGSDVPKMHRHYNRMQTFIEEFEATYQHLERFGAINVGADSYWWDYGTVQKYQKNLLKILDSTEEAKQMREFYQVSLTPSQTGIKCNGSNLILNSQIKSGSVKNSILIGVKADHLNVTDSIIINTQVGDLECEQSIVYNVKNSKNLKLKPKSVRTDVKTKDQTYPVITSLERDGKDDWSLKLPENSYSYEDLFLKNYNPIPNFCKSVKI